MHNAFQNRRLFLNQDFFYREAKRRRWWRDFFIDKRLLSVDVELVENRLLNIFEIYRVQNRFRASYVRNFIFFDYFDFALKWLSRMIAFIINTFFLIYWYFARWIIMRFDTDWTSSFMSTDFVDVIISLTIKTLFNSIIINKQFAKYLWILLLLIHTHYDIVLRRLMRKILYVLQKEKFSKRRKILLFWFNRHFDF
jgi:CDP-diglyceride synthetase